MPSFSTYLNALKEAVGDEQFPFAISHIEFARGFLDDSKRRSLASCDTNALRRELLDQWFGNYLASEVKNIIALLAEHGALDLMDADFLLESVCKTVTITSARSLPQDTKQWLIQELAQIVGALPVRWREDPRLIGGVKIRIGDQEIDASIGSRLNILTQ